MDDNLQNLKLLCVQDTDWIEILARKLTEQNIPFQIEEIPEEGGLISTRYRGQRVKCELYVREEDFARAQAADREVYLEQVPGTTPEQMAALDDLGHCPACGAPRNLQEETCPGCGLGFAFPEDE
ncbi:MAG: hypothetical protein U1F57_08300 [bacterium]